MVCCRLGMIGAIFLGVGLALAGDGSQIEPQEPRVELPQARGRSVAEALAGFQVRPGFKIECVASEPLVADPVAFDWSADGRLWVVEMGDYPRGEDGAGKPGGKVRVLTDLDGDGRYDQAETFLDGLSFPNGIAPHRDGVLISCSPDILFARDTNGDGKADEVKALYTGFNESNPQHRANGFAWGLDGWWYGADGESNTGLVSLKTGETFPLHGRDFKIHPDSGGFALESGRGQFGRQRDDWGNWFANNNSVWAWHAVLRDQDLSRNGSLAVASAIQMLEVNRRLYPVSPVVARFNDLDNAGLATSANSPAPYRDNLFGPAFQTSLFVSEPVHNVVHRMVLEPLGASFVGRRAPDETNREFLASTDTWFRPTQIKTGPDGALWVADMYRAVIEHPEWIPDDWEARIDLRAGHDLGRIYRILPVEATPRSIPNLARLSGPELVAMLDHAGGWQRDHAMRLLLERNEQGQVPALKRLVAEGKTARGRLQALATLECLNASDAQTLEIALRDSEPEVIRFAAEHVGPFVNGSVALSGQLEGLVSHPSARVRLGVALGLGAWDDPRAGRALARLLVDVGTDGWIQTAALSSCKAQAGAVLAELLVGRSLEQVPASVLDALLPLVFNEEQVRSGAVASLLRQVTDSRPGGIERAQVMALPALLEAASRSGFNMQAVPDSDREPIEAGVARIKQASRTWAVDRGRALPDRLAALRVLRLRGGADAADDSTEILKVLVAAEEAPELRRAAIVAMAQTVPERASSLLLGHWKWLSPGDREVVLDALLERPVTVAGLLFALEDGCVPSAEVPPRVRQALTRHPDPSLRERAEVVFEAATGNRAEVLATYRTRLRKGGGDVETGRAVFGRVCAACHRVQNVGVDVGPDLATLTDRSPEALLVAILDPNRAFETAYTEYVVGLRDGRLLTGRIAAETSNGLILRQTGGKDETLLRAEIETIASTGRSLMPEGLERELTAEDLNHLVAFLEAGASPPKAFDGNRPETVQADQGGVYRLDARRAAVHGSTLVFEAQYGNLGFWSSEDDRAVWTVDVVQPGRYQVWLDYALEASAAENLYQLVLDDQQLRGRVASTGGWDVYKTLPIGELRLEAGRLRLEFRSDGPTQGALIDLRAIELRPLP